MLPTRTIFCFDNRLYHAKTFGIVEFVKERNTMQKITPFLWFDGRAEEAMKFYTSVFKNSKVGSVARCGDGGPGPKGSVLTATFELEGLNFVALNAGPKYKFTPAISFVVNCQTQEEIDDYWEKISAGGKEIQCGWLEDKFGLSWQITPANLGKMLQDKDAAKSQCVMSALMKMVKLDIKALEQAYNGH
jgi:predicted 3-demethylubiquinone-9 3-methyltransferase (glyoxalase superfamily)